jgi:hypothetical protein
VHFCPGHAKPIKCTNTPFKLAFIPLDAPSLALSSATVNVQVGLKMVDCHTIKAP